jgi:hypothetical protein
MRREYKGTIHPGLYQRLVNLNGCVTATRVGVFKKLKLPDAEVLATHLLLGNEEYLPHHMHSQFFQQPSYPATKLVARLQKLGDVSPEFAKRAKPLLDNLNEFFPREQPSEE